MTHQEVLLVEIHRIALVNSLEDFGKGGSLCFNQHLYMIAHEHVSIDQKIVMNFVMDQKFQKSPIICLIPEYRLPLIPPDYYVIECALKFYPWFPSLMGKVSILKRIVNKPV